jgi:hypothetical protein
MSTTMQDRLLNASETLMKAKVWVDYVDEYGGKEYSFDKAMDEFNDAKAQLTELEDEFLPLGSHLLPGDFTWFLALWNAEITDACGDWRGANRREFKQRFPEKWAAFTEEKRKYLALYPARVEALKKYQREHPEERDNYVAPAEIPLPDSPPPEVEQEEQQEEEQQEEEQQEEEERQEEEQQEEERQEEEQQEEESNTFIPSAGGGAAPGKKGIPAHVRDEVWQQFSRPSIFEEILSPIPEFDFLTSTVAPPVAQPEPEAEAVAALTKMLAEAAPPVAVAVAPPVADAVTVARQPRSLYYNHSIWASPRAKILVQIYRTYYPVQFKNEWMQVHGDNMSLTHDNCLMFLAKKMGTSLTYFFQLSPREVCLNLFGTSGPFHYSAHCRYGFPRFGRYGEFR